LQKRVRASASVSPYLKKRIRDFKDFIRSLTPCPSPKGEGSGVKSEE
jgi:hypothetical protein